MESQWPVASGWWFVFNFDPRYTNKVKRRGQECPRYNEPRAKEKARRESARFVRIGLLTTVIPLKPKAGLNGAPEIKVKSRGRGRPRHTSGTTHTRKRQTSNVKRPRTGVSARHQPGARKGAERSRAFCRGCSNFRRPQFEFYCTTIVSVCAFAVVPALAVTVTV